jgi:SAM-dependent methyltransferase
MSTYDTNKWNNKYQSSSGLTDFVPDQELIEYRDMLPTSGLALDLACGAGKNTLFLAELGMQVVALDGSAVGLDWLRREAQAKGLLQQIELLEADLDDYQLPKSHFDLIIVIRYLNRQIVDDIRAALKPGGILLYKTFNLNILDKRPGFKQIFTIQTPELLAYFPNWDVLKDNRDDGESNSAFVLLRKPN